MTGVEVAVGGWFATSIISNVIDMARSYLGNNYDLHGGTTKMLASLENSLPQIQAAIEVASKKQITNRGLITWLNNLKNAAYEAEDILDDLEAKRMRKSSKGKNKVIEIATSSGKTVKTLIFSDKELKGLKSAIEKLTEISKGVEPFITLLKLEYSINTKIEHTDANRRETSSNLDPNAKIFGRDKEISFILDLILNCQLTSFPGGKSDQKPESKPNALKGREPGSPNQREVKGTRSFGSGNWFFGATRFREGNPSDLGREVKGQETGTIKSSIGEQLFSENTSEVGKEAKDQEMDNINLSVVEKYLDITKYEKENPSEVGKEGKDQGLSNINSSVGEQNSVCISNWKLHVLPIFGLGGVGKTTIAKIVYNNEIVKKTFDRRAWVYVSENFGVKRIMKEIVLSLQGSTNIDTMINLNTIVAELIKTIENRRFFLVLDDVQDGIQSVWSGLLSALRNAAPGSFILVTTQSELVAKTIGNMPNIITLDVLEGECFKKLFEYYAFGAFKLPDMEKQPRLLNLDEGELNTLKLIANKIVEKLPYLPLAGEVIGNMLHARLERVYWEDILKSDWWNDEYAHKGILPSLGINYKNLDPELKQCFAFCSIFPKHYVFDRNRLVQMWIAHGFVQPNKEEINKLNTGEIRLEDIGGKMFDKLVNRSFFQATIRDGNYIMHDVIRDLAIAVSSNEFCYVKSLDNHLPSFARHLAIDCDGSNVEDISHNNTSLRTVILFGNWKNCCDESIRSIFAKSNALRLLDLSYIRIPTKAPIDAVCQLLHLRFLDLSFCGIRFIPDDFFMLWHLQVLDVRGCSFRNLPKCMNKLVNLRHLYASAKTVSLISGIGNLTNLQELDKFCIGRSEGYRISELRDMNEISGHLLLSDLQNVPSKDEAATSQLAKKKYLKSLGLKFEYNNNQLTTRVELEVLEALKPPPSVEMLTIKGGGGEYLPSWISSTQNGLSNLKCIQVRSFWLTTLPAFGELPFLEILIFDDLPWIEKVGDEFYGRSNVVFPCLKELTFSIMPRWRVWSDAPVGKKSFPHLERIHLEYCRGLKEMPIIFSTSGIVGLKLLQCPNIYNIATILQSMPSLTHLSISNFFNKLSICCTVLRFLEVLCLNDVRNLFFIGGLSSLVNLRKLVVVEIGECMESFEVVQENDEISQENQEQFLEFLTYLHLGHHTASLSTGGRLPSLRTLFISYSPAVEYTREEESWFGQLTTLEELMFFYCQNLRHLPSTLPILSSLKKLTIVSCPSISSLPEDGLPEKLIELCITNCPDLRHQCQPYQGENWDKISHIPYIHIDVISPDNIWANIKQDFSYSFHPYA
ncbi:hypothetical protein LUZ63_000657 [Rhynchospora breviuscula]|uniref:Uncharacterized protein n=1 Tax=Rhynchospora breviuscula TaxID=2022672 RepID=A0A9Q0CVT6_9POAL|nr:hypothetical protein LUZ63_000657 [Rhynchospora breviuscula]